MDCPVCGSPTIVAESRDFGDYVARRRKCLDCNHTFFTGENVSDTAQSKMREYYRNHNTEIRHKKPRKSPR